MITPPKNNPMPKLERTATTRWSKGLVTAGGRMDTPKDGLFVADNVLITPEGALASRDPFAAGNIPDLPSSVDYIGPITSYWDPANERYDLLTICGGKLYLHETITEEWTEVPAPNGEVLFDMGQQAAYAQYGNLIAIADGKNALAYFTIPNETLSPSLSRPGDQIQANPGLALGDGEGTGDYRAFYLISYVNAWGETPASGGLDFSTTAQSVNVKLADDMDPLGKWETNVIITVTGVDSTLPHGARVRIYRVLTPDFISPSVTNYQLVKEFPVELGDQSFLDDGSTVPRVLAPQLENSTGGLVARYVTELDGRLWCLGAGKEYQKIYYTGAAPTDSPYPQFFTGDGGYFYVAYGTSCHPVTIKRGRADDGQICNFILCAGPNATGRRFNVFSLATTYGNQTIHQFYPEEQRGDEGAYSTFGVLDYMNSILYPSPVGFKTSGVRATYTGDNVTATIDQDIQDIVSAIPFNTLKNMYGTMYNGKAIWHTSPSSMLVFDAKNGGAWTRWTFPHSWFGSVSVEDNRVALYVVNGVEVLRYTDLADFKPRDHFGPTYPVIIKSGRLFIAPEDGREWVRLLQVLFVFSELEGPVRITVRANSRRRIEKYEGTIIANQDIFGVPEIVGADPIEFSNKDAVENRGEFGSDVAWSDGPFIMRAVETAGILEVRVKVGKDINFLDWEISSLQGFVGLKLEEFVYEYVTIGVGLDYSSRYNEVRLPITRG